MVLCARQLLQIVSRAHPEYWKDREADVATLGDHLAKLDTIRTALLQREDASFGIFLDWFDVWFLKRASKVERVDD